MAFRATYRRNRYRSKGRTRRTRAVPGLHLEKSLYGEGAEIVAGLDEVGVGAWAGPVAVGAVVLDPDHRIYKVRDSKLLDPARREWLAERVRERCLSWSVGLSWPDEIDEVGLTEALRRAGGRALRALGCTPEVLLLDGRHNYLGDERTRVLVRGDSESLSIAAASLVAKVERDGLMCRLHSLFPDYRFDSNKGYPSAAHKWALAAFGPAPIHRRLFAPVRLLLEEGVPGRLLPSPNGR